ncbi:hypothetical protein [Streptomyces rubiginosohelvolus]|uniref:hypothetical protein n=1 Tax=Streptomyces rubiginosohelvolus TaxID=67362 RepID=UPI003F4E4329
MTSPPTRPAIRAEGLTKRFGKKQALNGVDLEAAPGTVLGSSARTARARPPR